jgi:DNA-binding NarL/FixJ family response regulator
LFRLGLVGVLRDHNPSWQLVEIENYAGLALLPDNRPPSILLLEEQLPGLAGSESITAIRLSMPDTKIIVLIEADARDHVFECLDAGAQGCLTTSAQPAQVLAAFNTVLCGGLFIPAAPRDIASPIPVRPMNPALLANGLTDRQRDVFDLMAQGYSTKLIARQLGLAVGTVKVHLAAIYRLLGAHNRAEAVARMIGTGYVNEAGTASDPLDELGLPQ